MGQVQWTKKMDEFILNYYTKIGVIAAAKRLDLKTEEVSKRADWLGATKRKDMAVLGEFDMYAMNVRELINQVRIGSKVRVKGVSGSFRVHSKHPHFVVIDNGKYREAILWSDALNKIKVA